MSNSNHCCSASNSTSNLDGTAFPAHVHTDIIRTHILTKLDGPTLASAGCVSSELNALCHDENLWIKICHSNWPSINDPRVRDAIATCSTTYRSFFSNCFSSLPNYHHEYGPHETSRRALAGIHDHVPMSSTAELISAIDIHYKDRPVCSMVHVTEGLPTLVDQLISLRSDSSKASLAPPKFLVDEDQYLPENVTLSWIVIDRARKLAANLSSLRPVLVKPHWQKGHTEMRYSTVLAAASGQMVEFRITVITNCQLVKDGGREEVIVKEVTLEVQDLQEGKYLTGKDSLVILHKAMESRNIRRGNYGKQIRYEELLKMMRNHRSQKLAKGKEIGSSLFKDVGVLVTSLVVLIFFCFLVLVCGVNSNH